MKKLFLIVSLLCSSLLGASAQDYKTPSNELSVSWGLASGPMIADAFASALTGNTEYAMQTGTISAQYMHNLNKTLGIGITASFEGLSAKKTDAMKEDLSNNYINIMPTARAYWFRKSMFGMYSRAAAGVTVNSFDYLNTQDGKTNKDSKTEVGFAWQVSPVGIEIGNNQVSGFLEGGFGYQGMVIAGVRLGL